MFPHSSMRARRVGRRATGALGLVTALVRTLGFWTAVVLPLAYLPLLVAPGSQSWTLLPALLGTHAVTLVVGHGHDPGALRDSLPTGDARGHTPEWRPPR